MLIEFESGKAITKVPYEQKYRRCMARLTSDEIAAIKSELASRFDATEIQTAGWMPGSDWSGTPFQPIYEKAAKQNQELAAQLFGLVVWETVMEHPDRWFSGRFEKDGEEIGSRTYFLERR